MLVSAAGSCRLSTRVTGTGLVVCCAEGSVGTKMRERERERSGFNIEIFLILKRKRGRSDDSDRKGEKCFRPK